MSAGYHRGTSAGQDQRFTNKEKKLLSSQKFPKELSVPVDMSKVKLSVMKPWISRRVTELLGVEDDVLINFIFSQLEEKDVNPKKMQINLTGFMEKNTSLFMKELWRLVISASKNPQGIPDEILEEQKAMHEKQVEAQKRVQEEIAKRMERHIGAKDTKATDPSPSAAAAAAVTTTATTASAPTSAPAKRRHRWDRDTETDAKDSSKRSRQEEDSKSRSGQSRDSTRDRKDRSRESERR